MPKSQASRTRKRTDSVHARVPARRLTPKGEATRARLIELAAGVFAEEGYAAASIRESLSTAVLKLGEFDRAITTPICG